MHDEKKKDEGKKEGRERKGGEKRRRKKEGEKKEGEKKEGEKKEGEKKKMLHWESNPGPFARKVKPLTVELLLHTVKTVVCPAHTKMEIGVSI